MAFSLNPSICVNCSKNLFSVSGDTTGSLSGGVSAQTVVIGYPNDDSVTLDLYANNDGLTGNTLYVSALGCTSVSLTFDVSDNKNYNLYVIYTDTNGDLAVNPITYPSDGTATADEIGAGILAALSANGVTASYDSGVVTFSGTGFGVAAVNSSTTNIELTGVTAELIPDGKHVISWSITDGAGTYSSSSESYFLCNVECCVRSKMSAIDAGCLCSDDRNADAAIDAMLTLEQIRAAAACGKDSKADKLLEELQAICNNECKSC